MALLKTEALTSSHSYNPSSIAMIFISKSKSSNMCSNCFETKTQISSSFKSNTIDFTISQASDMIAGSSVPEAV